MKQGKRKFIVGLVATIAIFAAGCTASNKNGLGAAAQNDAKSTGAALSAYQRTQPLPRRPYSQMRQNLIEIEASEMDSVQTTSFFFNQGVRDPIDSCPSIGYPVPAADQLTASQSLQKTVTSKSGHSWEWDVLPQGEITGVFGGDTTGTHVLCVGPGGKAYQVYWEGYVHTVTAAAVWDNVTHQVKLVGDPTYHFSKTSKDVKDVNVGVPSTTVAP